MMKNYVLLCTGFFIGSFLLHAQNFPGGVPDAEIWYKATHDDLQNGEYRDFSVNHLSIAPCDQQGEALFNFNPSINGRVCLTYVAPLESVTAHNLFIVSEPKDEQESYRHISTRFNGYVPSSYRDSLSRNTYVIETQQGYASRVTAAFAQHQLANVHFYGWNNYDSDKKFKSYGQQGETEFFIGTYLPFPKLQDGVRFEGLLPEYLSFDRKLTDNERNRVESYLALKYGITLHSDRSYKNSKNKIFWDKQNNNLFGTNIFGIGRDDISGLNQLQCESAHNRDYLVAATVQIGQTNAEVQNNVSIANNDFLVFGDTGNTGLAEPNEQNLRLLNKVWLAQVTGERIREFPIHFRLDLNNEFQPFIQQLQAGNLVLWMLHDQYVDNSYVSEFDNGQVEYYKPVDIEFLPTGEIYAHYKDKAFFDRDRNFFDQFTFAVGPEILIQVRYVQWQCKGECFQVEIVVIGGEPGYDVALTDESGTPVNVGFSHEEGNEFIYRAEVCGDQEYTVIVHDSNGSQADYSFYVEARNYTLDLGPDQYLTSEQPTAVLDAGQGIDDPNATYEWYYNGQPINHPGSILETDEVGEYCVVVTTSDMSCQLEDCIKVLHRFNANINSGSGCSEEENYIEVLILEGTSPYTTNVSGNGLNFNHAHTGNTTITNFSYAGDNGITYTVTVTDATGASYQETVNFSDYSSSGSLGPNQTLSSTQQTIMLDGSLPFGNDPDFTYQWFRDGTLLASTDPQLTVEVPGVYQVVVTFADGCKGKASVTIGYDLEGSIVQESDCDEASNTINILFDYGLPLYTTTISGTLYPSGAPYSHTQTHTGDITLSGIPYGDYTVNVSDDYGGILYQQMEFVGLDVNINQQLMDLCTACPECTPYTNYCDSGLPAIYPCGPSFFLDASTLIQGGQNVSYEWSINGVPLNYSDPGITFIQSNECTFYDFENFCDGLFISVTVTDPYTGCSIEQTVVTIIGWCPVLDGSAAQPPGLPFAPTLTTKIYPNPSDPSSTFYYEVFSEETFEGTVEVHDMTGSLLHRVNITGKSSYTLPFDLLSAGVYFISTKTRGTRTTDKIIIK